MATLKEIAAAANVDISTASRALNGIGSVNPATKERIVEVAKKLNYFSARKRIEYSVKTLRTVGVLCPELKCSSTAQIVETIEEKLQAEGYSILLGMTKFGIEPEMQYLQIFENKKVDGVILITCTIENENGVLDEFSRRTDIPLVQVSTDSECPFYDIVKLDNVMAATLAVEHLLSLGHRRIAYIGDEFSTVRCKTYLEIMRKNGIQVPGAYVRIGPSRYEELGYAAANAIFDTAPLPPTAIFASYDNIALGAIKALTDRGLDIPRDVSVVGIDNISSSGYYYRALTTVSNPVRDIGLIAARILLEKIRDKSNQTAQQVMVRPSLILRETTAVPRQKV